MEELSAWPQLRLAIVEVFAPEVGTGLRVGVCAAPFGSSVDHCDRDWCDDVRQRFELGVLLVDGTSSGPRRDLRVAVPVRGFDDCGEMSRSMASLVAGFVSDTLRHSSVKEPAHSGSESPAGPAESHGRVTWVPIQGLSTCRVRRALLAPVGVSLGLQRSDMDFALPSVVASEERSTLIVPVRDRATVQLLEHDPVLFAKVCGQLGLAGCLVYAPTASITRVVARLITPGLGTFETIATPVAAGALAKVLIAHGLLERTMTFGVEQIRPGGGSATIEVIVEAQARSRKVWAGGRTRFAGWRTVDGEALVADPAA